METYAILSWEGKRENMRYWTTLEYIGGVVEITGPGPEYRPCEVSVVGWGRGNSYCAHLHLSAEDAERCLDDWVESIIQSGGFKGHIWPSVMTREQDVGALPPGHLG